MGIEKKQKKEKEKKEEKLTRTNKKLKGDMDRHIKDHNEKQNKVAQEEDEHDFGKVKCKAKRFGKDTSQSCMIVIIVISRVISACVQWGINVGIRNSEEDPPSPSISPPGAKLTRELSRALGVSKCTSSWLFTAVHK